MKRQNIRVRRNGGSKTASPQASTKPEPASAKQGIQPNQTVPPWLTIKRLAQLKVLAANKTKFGLGYETIRTLARKFRVELEPGNDMDLVLMAELGWVESPGHDDWRITEDGRAALNAALEPVREPSRVTRAYGVDDLVRMIQEMPAWAQRLARAEIKRLSDKVRIKLAAGGAR